MRIEPRTRSLFKEARDLGYNLYPYLGRYYKQTKRKEELPYDVVHLATIDFISKAGKEKVDVPILYFFSRLRIYSERHNVWLNQRRNKLYSHANTQLLKDVFQTV